MLKSKIRIKFNVNITSHGPKKYSIIFPDKYTEIAQRLKGRHVQVIVTYEQEQPIYFVYKVASMSRDRFLVIFSRERSKMDLLKKNVQVKVEELLD